MRKRIAIVNQRYGEDVNGGSEYYTRELAKHLQSIYDVEVLTTTARDYDTWKPYYRPGVEIHGGVRIRRFPVKKPRNIPWFKLVNKLVRTVHLFPGLLETLWVREQGPFCPELIHYIKESQTDYDAFIFVTYLYYTTVMGLPAVADKAILVPTAHDEYCIYFQIYRKVFTKLKAIVFLTEEEKEFVHRLFENRGIPCEVAGSGIDIGRRPDSEAFRKKYGVDQNYVIYVGRVDTSKKCDVMFDYFLRYKEEHGAGLKLVVVGKVMMNLPHQEDILSIGFVSEEEKYDAMAGARALILPSEHESLSLAVLESMTVGVPVLVNGGCEVLRGHCEKSGAGFSYISYGEFAERLNVLLSDKRMWERMSEAGIAYVKDNYGWEKTIEKYRILIEG